MAMSSVFGPYQTWRPLLGNPIGAPSDAEIDIRK